MAPARPWRSDPRRPRRASPARARYAAATGRPGRFRPRRRRPRDARVKSPPMSEASARAESRAVPRSPAGARYAVIASRWNAPVVDALVRGALDTLRAHGVAEADVRVWRVPGAWDIPVLAA